MIKKISLLLGLLLVNCATYKTQISSEFSNWKNIPKTPNSEIDYSIYLIGDAGNINPKKSNTFKNLQAALQKENSNSSLLFLGDNIYPKGIPSKKDKKQKTALKKLNNQLDITRNYNGNTFFIPGNHDWYNGLDGLKKQEEIVNEFLNKTRFLPKDGCPLEVVHLNKNIDVIFIDSQWFITNWDKHPKINNQCDEIKTRHKFFVELEGLINKSQDKLTLIAMHHPISSRGPHGGFNSFKKHIFPFSNYVPLPGLGTLFQTIRKTSGINPQDLQGHRYNELIQRITTLAKNHDRLIFTSGHEHSLQYLINKDIPQIISGSGSKKSATYLGKEKGFTAGQNGYVKLEVYKNKKVVALFKSNNKTIFKATVFEPITKKKPANFKHHKKGDFVETSIYPKELVTKNKFYKFLWGEHYRKAYGQKVKAKTVLLDTLYGGLTVVKKGGGHQSKSLRLKDKVGKQYVMRALKKSAIRFLQTVAFTKDYIAPELKDTYTENLLYDFYTSAHPYTPFIVGDLSDSIHVLHTNPKLFYVPMQKTLIPFNNEFGDALYMIEERPEKHHKDQISFEKPDDIISTDDLFSQLRKNKKNKLDERSYITARLFDMVIGDWDRHVDQWRWAVFKDGNQKTFKPIPRDRDQAFSNYDGFILESITTIVDAVKLMQTYKPEVRNLFKFNDEPYPIDVSLLQESNYSLWLEQAKYIQTKLTDKIIDQAFTKLPKNIQNETTEKIKSYLKYRRDHIVAIATNYKQIMEEFAIVKGTDKDDYFEILSTKEKTTIKLFNLKKGQKEKLHFTKEFNNQNTKEIWIYGLDDDDSFCVIETKKESPKIRLIGGQNNDTYHIEKSAKKVIVHDFVSKKNKYKGNIKKRLSDRYNNNIYQFRKVKDHTQTIFPTISLNPDDGFAIGVNYNRINYGYNRHPFTNKHKIRLKYYTATNGFDASHHSEFATYWHQWNMFIKTRLTSANFSNNFFGFGNETKNNNDNLNFNRVKTIIYKIAPGISWNNLEGTTLNISIPLKSLDIDPTSNRFITTTNTSFKPLIFTGINTEFHYSETNNKALPSKGLSFNLNPNWEYNTTEKNALLKIQTSLGMMYPITSNQKWIVNSKIYAQQNIGPSNFMPYQAAFIGGNRGLRGFRNERFAGKSSFAQNSNLRYTINNTKTSILPITYGVSLGFDYGRVWLPNEESTKWHTSYGTSFWFSAPGVSKANLNLFSSKEGLRFTFGIGVNW